MALQQAADEKAADAFVDTLSDRLDVTIDVPARDAVRALQTAADQRRGGAETLTGKAAERRLTSALGLAPDAMSLHSAQKTADALDAALAAAQKATQREIPVYESDGNTRIGVFLVG